MRKFGLIGFPLSHSFSKKYFTEKFEKEGIENATYELFPIESIEQLPALIASEPDLIGLNVTIPYKELVLPFLDELDAKAEAIGAVNTITIRKGKLKGYNTDYYGFKSSLTQWIGANPLPEKAFILGTGGASKAVKASLEDLDIPYQFVSRTASLGQLTYKELNETGLNDTGSTLIINTTPLGTSPNTGQLPDLPYEQLSSNDYLFDLVYNPLVTAFMQKGIQARCWVKNGLEMLHGQAEKAWEIWDS